MSNATPSRAEQARTLFGRRKGRPLRPQHARLIETVLPRLALDLDWPAPDPLAELFASPTRTLRLEIGFGGGEHMTEAAEAHPEVGFIGCEPFLNGMAQTLSRIEAKRLANIRLHGGDAADVIGWLPGASLAGVDLLYPDPWPKRRHWKRRFIREDNIAALARVLAPGGELRFATDWPDYAAWTLERMLRSPHFIWTAEQASDWRSPWPGHTRTRYEAKAVRAGRQPCYLAFRRRDWIPAEWQSSPQKT